MRASILAVALVVASSVHGAPPHRKAVHHSSAADSPKIHQIPQSGILNEADLVAIAKLHVGATADQFSDDPSLAYIGREFTITLPADAVSIDYDKQSHTLRVATHAWDDSVDLEKDESRRSFIGQNGYGAKAQVTEFEGSDYGIWMPGHAYDRKAITYTTTADPSTARALSEAIRLRLTGRIVKAGGTYAEPGSAVMRRYLSSDATVEDPTALHVTGYYLATELTSGEWIDERTGNAIGPAAISTP